ncbi:MAG: sulfur oxidation c-type cytochrome SoxX [bacterium]|nr:sulfur oxidation c-type cytochrome SoxX [bacterium]
MKKQIALVLIGLALSTSAVWAADIEKGKEIAFDRKKGNCLACHQIEGGELAGTVGPPLVAMKQRFEDRQTLWAQIYDSTAANPNSMMPPFGRHGILSDAELEAVVDYIHSL